MNNNETSQFATYDLSLATALVSCGYSVDSIENTQYGTRAMFIFSRSVGLDEALQSYWSNNLRVNPKLYYDELKHLKTRLLSRS